MTYCTRLLAGTILFLAIATATAQETRFFIPSEIVQAYDKGTRSYNGAPGPAYWHNTVDYTIEVEVVPEEMKLIGKEDVVYYNNSPDVLQNIVIRLYHDVFREANARAYRVNPDDINEGVTITRMYVGDHEIDVENRRAFRRQGTNVFVQLPEPLESGGQLELEIDWMQLIPETTVRTGAYDSTTFFIAYWYPQIAVYDDVFGWDRLSYDFSTEFYNNLGNFDVTITAPEQYSVLATGVLQNPEEVFQPEQLERYRQAQNSSETVAIVSLEDLESGLTHKSGTWHYKADVVSDFSFCLSDHFGWDAAAQQVEDRMVLIHTYYNNDLEDGASEVTQNQRKMMKHFSEDMPGVPYPYPEFTTFVAGAGGGGMETPMMANNGGPGLGVTVHEMFHTYFPMYVRTNEKRFAWMDEGWADFNTSYIIDRFFNEDDAPLYGQFTSQLRTMGTLSDLPLITSTQFMDNSNYGYASYPLPAFIYSVLMHHLGEEMFQKCYSTYIERWALKSPTPYDFFYTFENVSGEDLSWMWIPWFFQYGSVDVELEEYKNGKLKIRNNGTRPVPVSVKVDYKDSTSTVLEYSAKNLSEAESFVVKVPRKKDVKSVKVNWNLPDGDVMNNQYPSLKDLYKGYKLPETITGTYDVQEFPVQAIVSVKDDLLHLRITGSTVNGYLLPLSDTDFETMDGNIQLKFTIEDGEYVGFSLYAPGSGIRANAKKQST